MPTFIKADGDASGSNRIGLGQAAQCGPGGGCRSGCVKTIQCSQRRFPPPWSVEEQDACFVVRDHNGQQLAYVYFEEEPGRRSAARLLSKDEARRIKISAATKAAQPRRW
jgi:hypothetical protein